MTRASHPVTTTPVLQVRPAREAEIPRLAEIWHDAWLDAHAALLPEELKRLRTLESFRDRLAKALPRVRVVDVSGEPAGICMIKGDELYQLFVAAHARGTGAAIALIDDAEARIRDTGVKLAWLTCAIGNDRAARFYEKRGWRRTGVVPSRVETTEGEFELDAWRYEKPL